MIKNFITVAFLMLCSVANSEVVTYRFEGIIKRISNDTTGDLLHVGSKVELTVSYDTEIKLSSNPTISITNGSIIFSDYGNEISANILLNGNLSIDIKNKMTISAGNEYKSYPLDAINLVDRISILSRYNNTDFSYLNSLPKINGQMFLNFFLEAVDENGLAIDKNYIQLPHVFGNTEEYDRIVLQLFVGTINESDLKSSNWGIYSADITLFELVDQ